MTNASQPLPQAFKADQADWFLQFLVDIVNNNGVEIGITLSVGGTSISGMLVGVEQFFNGFGAEFGGAFPDQDVSNSIRDSFSQFGKPLPATEGSEDEKPLQQPNYVHLKNAKFYHNSGPAMPSNRGLWWRGRLTQVDGFSLGNFA